MHKPLVSILITVYNAEQYLGESLDSVINQSYTNLEIIIVNDGSTDNSAKIIDSFRLADNRVHFFSTDNRGQSAASNFAINKSKGDYIKFLDADDILSDDHIELQLECLQGINDFVASCEWGRFYNNNYLSAIFNPEPVWKDMETLDWIKVALSQKSDMMGAWLWLIPRKVLDIAGFWNEELSLNNDFDFSIRLLLAAKGVKFAKGAKLYYRSGLSSSLSQTFSKKAVESALLTTRIGCHNILQKENTELTRMLCANRYQTWVYRIYPQNTELLKKFESEVKELGGSNIKMDGGRFFILFRDLFGWKLAKKMQLLFYKLGWKVIAKIKFRLSHIAK